MKISPVFTHAGRPGGGGQRLISVSLALRRAEKRSAYPRSALPLAT